MTINDIFIETFIEDNFSKININSTAKVLDIGCGKHTYSKLYSNNVSLLVNTDIQKNCQDLDCYADALNAPFLSSTFDIVMLCEVLEHLPNPNAAIAEVYRVLKPGGYVIITWPFNYSLHDLPLDFIRFTEFGISQLLRTNMLELTKIQRRGDMFAVLHTIAGQLFVGGVEVLCRLRLIGRLFFPAHYLIKICAKLSYRVHYFLIKNSKRLNPDHIGRELGGLLGSLALWSLGYCVLGKKPR